MKRSLNTSTLMVPTSDKYVVTQNYCPLPQKKKDNYSNDEETPSEVDLLVSRYRELIIELNKIRGKLYTLGVNPDK